MRRPDLIVFDLDGTLIDTAPDIAYAVDAMLVDVGLAPVGVERVRDWIGNGVSMLVKRALSGEMQPAEEPPLYQKAYPVFLELYQQNLSGRGEVYPGVFEGLKQLKEEGFRHACITNKHSRFTLPLMEQTGLAPYFDYIGCGNEFEKHKPHPMPLLKTAERFQVAAERCLMVGDSLNDMVAARAAGFQTICVPYGYRCGERMEDLAPDLVIESLAELPALFASA